VDDDESNRITLATLFECEGFVVDTASSLAEARRLLASGAAYTLVLLDYHLGDGVGTELVADVRRAAPNAMTAILTGNAAEREMHAGITGICGWFEKGTAFDDLNARIAALAGSC
jgi:DNA-binding response OmpR family regulator